MGLFEQKPLKLFFVLDKNIAESGRLQLEDLVGKIYTITATQEQAMEYICNLLIEEKYDHFVQWCELRGFDPDDPNAKDDYLIAFNPNLYDIYTVYEMEFPKESIACLMRMFFYCIPLECSFTTDMEIDRFNKLAAFYDENIKEFANEVDGVA